MGGPVRNKERVLNYITRRQEKIYLENEKILEDFGVTAEEIAETFQIARPNVSSLLNDLVREGILIKVSTRPVYYFLRSMIEQGLGIDMPHKLRSLNRDAFLDAISKRKPANKNDEDSIFKNLIGYDGSLKTQVEQLKAAVLYPPYGLHSLIIGPSGSGKSFMVELMYNFSRKIGRHEKMNVFNCADYYNNPQLLMSYLFGHAKGAYTGAESDRPGLVELSDRGILFLDEVHRLPPEGQEMLFLLIDKGEYYRLGDPIVRKANLMIVAATTEDPNSVLLKTFIRRIPMIVRIPPLEERPLKEKLDIIKELVFEEARRVKSEIVIFPETLKGLLCHRYDGNVGELKSTLQMMCAKAFARNFYSGRKEILIDVGVLPDYIRSEIVKLRANHGIELTERIEEPLIISSEGDDTQQAARYDLYDLVLEKIKALEKQGLSRDDIEVNIAQFIDEYFRTVTGRFKKLSLQEFEKIVSRDIIKFTMEMIKIAESELGMTYSENFVYTVALHFQSLLERMKRGNTVVNLRLNEIKEKYKKEYNVAKKILSHFKVQFGMDVPEDEAGFITVFLTSDLQKKANPCVGIIVIAHGDSAASSMARVANKLLGIDRIKAFDMPLNMTIDEALGGVTEIVRETDEGKGVLLLIDMGSLRNFGEIITRLTGIKTATVDRVNTPLILECARKSYFLHYDLDSIVEAVTDVETKKTVRAEKPIIITVCSTGEGTAEKLKKFLENKFQQLKNYEILPFNLFDLKEENKNFKDILSTKRVVCIIGAIDPGVKSIPFIPLEVILKNPDTIINIIENNEISIKARRSTSVAEKNGANALNEEIIKILEEFLTYINPIKMARAYSFFVRELEDEMKSQLKEDVSVKLGVHLGCAVERIITNNYIIFPEKETFIKQNARKYQVFRHCLQVIEKSFNVSFNDDEICYCIEVLNKLGPAS
ncbi:sigma 54-interacting transcriptional regulator [Thermoanaerobacterium sp. DL9XJH110]|uniref:sigma 54-interacting transcriptional regulator n=1 Tax=Thermoanaerobacterium sp. DL9XJH110 TaxID=3386643 RepID=UPI003BB5E91C